MAEPGDDAEMWPYGVVRAAGPGAAGVDVVPVHEFVLKIYQRCNLACDYCYVYTKADQTWRDRSTVMAEHVWTAAVTRMGDHVRAHRQRAVSVILHGGEPLLAGTDRIGAIAAAIRGAMPSGTRVLVGIQTNGVLLTEERLSALRDHDIRVAVSLDGTAAAHNLHRRHRDGRGSFDEVSEALGRLSGPAYRGIFAGLLCTVDPRTDPVECHRTLAGFRPPAIDLLLPHANWETGTGSGGHGDWLVRFFDDWFDQPVKTVDVRLFDELISLHLGGQSRSEHVGLSPAAVAVVETDGTIEQTDALKSAYPNAAATGYSVLRDSFDALMTHPGYIARQLGRRALCETCLSCPVRDLCGAGHYAHRYRSGSGFLNPSVYCADMRKLVDHVGERVRRGIAERISAPIGEPPAPTIRRAVGASRLPTDNTRNMAVVGHAGPAAGGSSRRSTMLRGAPEGPGGLVTVHTDKGPVRPPQ